jgi:hypothetical protein
MDKVRGWNDEGKKKEKKKKIDEMKKMKWNENRKEPKRELKKTKIWFLSSI